MNMRRSLGTATAFLILFAAACSGAAVSPTATSPASGQPGGEQPSATQVATGDAIPTSVGGGGPRSIVGRPTPQPTPTVGKVATADISDEAERVVAAEEEVLNRVYEVALPSIVNITVAQRAAVGDVSPFGFGFGQGPGGVQPTGQGSGFVWDQQGHIVTNNHVVAGADVVSVEFFDGTEVVAEVVGTDPFSDLAVVKVDLPRDRLKPVALGDSAQLKVGQMAIAIGHPFGQSFTLTSGIVSAVGRLIPSGATPFGIPEAVQTDAAINPGNSGGPLLDREARVIGINAQIETESGSNAGVGFAIPINIAKIVVPALIKDGEYDYAFLGVSLRDVSQEIAGLLDLPQDTRGALIVNVTRGEPADRSGLRGGSRTNLVTTAIGEQIPAGGDVIIRVGDTPIGSSVDLISYTALRARPDEKVKMTVLRDGKEQTLEVTLGARPR